MTVNTELYHFGVKGMRWGHRKARPKMSGSARSARRKRIAKRVALGVGAAAGAAALGYGAYRANKYVKTPTGAMHVALAGLRAQQGIDRVKSGASTAGTAVKGVHSAVKKTGKEAIRKRVEQIHDYTSPQAIARREVARSNKRIARSMKLGEYANLAGQAKTLGVRGSARAVGSAAKTYGKAMGAVTRVGAHEVGKAAKSRASSAASAAGSYVLGGKRSKTRANLRSAASSARGIGQKLRQGRAAAEVAADVYRTRRKYQGKHAAHFAYDSPGEALYHFALDPYGRYAIF